MPADAPARKTDLTKTSRISHPQPQPATEIWQIGTDNPLTVRVLDLTFGPFGSVLEFGRWSVLEWYQFRRTERGIGGHGQRPERAVVGEC